MRRACDRLLARLPDERGSGNASVIFTAGRDSLQIQIGDSSEIIPATMTEAGIESVPCLQFSGMAQTLRFYRKKEIEVTVADNQIKVERMVFRQVANNR
jgi:hypothetical protein